MVGAGMTAGEATVDVSPGAASSGNRDRPCLYRGVRSMENRLMPSGLRAPVTRSVTKTPGDALERHGIDEQQGVEWREIISGEGYEGRAVRRRFGCS